MFTHNVVFNAYLPLFTICVTVSLINEVLSTKINHNLQTRLAKAKILGLCSNCNDATQKDDDTSRKIRLM